jgi:DNA topoisomerase-1
VLGTDPETGAAVTRRMGRFGPYVQLGEPAEDGEKPKRSSIPKGKDPASVTFEEAMRYLSLPREVGLHPETRTPIVANVGRFGPYILHDGVYANLKDPDDVYTIGLNRAVDLLHEKRSKGPSNRARPGALKNLGPHPDGGGNIEIMGGRYGAYVKYGKVNATLPKDKTPEDLTLEEALALIAERSGKAGGKTAATKKPAAKKAAKKSAKKAVKKPAARKAPAKKVAPAA